MHDDQHGTAIISSAALLNALELAEKKIENAKIIVSGAGSAALACKLYVQLGVSAANIIMFDKDGVLSNDRTDLSLIKNGTQLKQNLTLAEAIKGADVF
jgi:malate dehydrogenase (oxaloacetate-decarboxylating)(NADP+)